MGREYFNIKLIFSAKGKILPTPSTQLLFHSGKKFDAREERACPAYL
jgi:hypothetical protein